MLAADARHHVRMLMSWLMVLGRGCNRGGDRRRTSLLLNVRSFLRVAGYGAPRQTLVKPSEACRQKDILAADNSFLVSPLITVAASERKGPDTRSASPARRGSANSSRDINSWVVTLWTKLIC